MGTADGEKSSRFVSAGQRLPGQKQTQKPAMRQDTGRRVLISAKFYQNCR
ncbi:hypothetical protein SBA4_3530010 [Candidatus Sulfopaludibacter sp. SbA4]|nr:hypothetical protein SBA4_3530010 [Candidatus Sulfopaludibacter sp. SbA4]